MGEVIVLCYHAISPQWRAELSLPPDALYRQLSFLIRRGWRPVTFTEAVTGSAQDRLLAVTFDDAFASVKQYAAPILRQLGAVGTVFAPTDFMGGDRPLSWPGIDHWRGGQWATELEAMTWDDLRALRAEGWEIGSHTCSHARLPTLDDSAIRRELTESRRRCAEELGVGCRAIAFPYGEFDERVIRHVGEAGYDASARLTANLRPAGPHAYPRTGIYRMDSFNRFRLKVARPMRLVRASPLWPDLLRV